MKLKWYWVLVALIAGLVAGGMYVAKLDYFNLSDAGNLRERGDSLSRALARVATREIEYIELVKLNRERIEELEIQLVRAKERERIAAESLDRTKEQLRAAEETISRATGGVGSAREATDRMGKLFDELENTIRRLQGDSRAASGDS